MAHYSETGKLGKKGVFTIPSVLRKRQFDGCCHVPNGS